jgi:large subunit ribosomal protein L17
MIAPKKSVRFGKSASNQKSILRNLAISLFENGRIVTTVSKGKFLRGFVDKLVTFAKKGDLSSRRVCIRMMNNSDIVKKLFDEIGPAGYDRNGGHTKLIKYKNRHGDGAELVIVELIK